MLRHNEDDWSDSDGESNNAEVETSVLLGIPDGDIDSSVDISDPSVSRIGGHPAFLPSLPLDPSSSHCRICSNPMPLLVQMWCPFEGSAMDRAIYIWGCKGAACQHKDGRYPLFLGSYDNTIRRSFTHDIYSSYYMKASIRAWRGLKFNPKYAAKMEKKRAQEVEKAARKASEAACLEEEKKKQTMNPFSLSSSASSRMPSGLGTHLFGADTRFSHEEETVEQPPPSDTESDLEYEVDSDGAERPILQEVSPVWQTFPSYKPVYLSTVTEYVSPLSKSMLKTEKHLQEASDDKSSGKDWGMEGWEHANIDNAFDKFTKRILSEPEQCVRYDLQGTPLPFGSQDKVYDRLFPPAPPALFTTKPGFADPVSQHRIYKADTVDKCENCGGARVFECQLMPHLINVLRVQQSETAIDTDNKTTSAEHLTDEEKRRRLLSSVGMEWGTCFVFACEKDCCDDKEGWREELILIQWDE